MCTFAFCCIVKSAFVGVCVWGGGCESSWIIICWVIFYFSNIYNNLISFFMHTFKKRMQLKLTFAQHIAFVTVKKKEAWLLFLILPNTSKTPGLFFPNNNPTETIDYKSTTCKMSLRCRKSSQKSRQQKPAVFRKRLRTTELGVSHLYCGQSGSSELSPRTLLLFYCTRKSVKLKA